MVDWILILVLAQDAGGMVTVTKSQQAQEYQEQQHLVPPQGGQPRLDLRRPQASGHLETVSSKSRRGRG